MRRDARAYLWDIQQAADAILEFVTGMDRETYSRNEIVHSAVERKFEIIGEALSQLAKVDPELAGRIPDAREIIAFRNVLIHGYATIGHDRVWRIVEAALPGLKSIVTKLLTERGPP